MTRLLFLAGGRTATALIAIMLCSTSVHASDEPCGVTLAEHGAYVQNELLVKFRAQAAAALQKQIAQKRPAAELKLADTLDRLFTRYRVDEVAPVFASFRGIEERLQALQLQDPLELTETERRLVARKRRASANASIPALDRIFKMRLAPGVSVEAAVDDFRGDPSVEFAEPNYYFYADGIPDDTYFDQQWALHNTGQVYHIPYGSSSGTADSDIDAPEAWDVYVPGQDVIVAIADSGVAYYHPELAANMWTDADGRYGYDFANEDDNPMDDLGHGTRCAGVVGAVLNNALGISGVCPNAKIMAVKFLDGAGRGAADLAAQAIYYAVDHGADVISNSYGYSASSETLRAALDYAHSQGVIIVASAGNDDVYVPHYPAAYDHVIAVAATDSDDIKASFSNFGGWVDVSAPGVDIASLRLASTQCEPASGTSLACPHVAGAVAMLISHFPELAYDEIVSRLVGTTDEIVEQNPGLACLLGSGRLNVANALTDIGHPAIVYADHEILNDDNGNGHLEPGESASLSVALKNLWIDATDVNATLGSANPWITIPVPTSYYGVIPAGQEKENAEAPFEIHLSQEAASDVGIEFALTVTSDCGYTRVVGFSTANYIPLQGGEWPRDWPTYAQPLPYDVDGDGQTELIVSDGDAIRIVKPDGSDARRFVSGSARSSFVAGDLDGNGHVEIVGRYAYDPSYFVVWDVDGNQIAPHYTPMPVQEGGIPSLFDVDDDGELEIVTAGSLQETGRFVLRVLGWVAEESRLETEWETFVEVSGPYYSETYVATGNIDAGDTTDDGTPEFVFGVNSVYGGGGAELFAVRSSGQLVEGWPITVSSHAPAPVLADLSGDGNLEIIVNGYDSEDYNGLRVFDRTGTLLWTGVGRGRDPIAADLDNDGDLEVLTQSHAYHHDGTFTGWTYATSNPGGASVGDIDGDGDMEVLIGSLGLYGFHHDGRGVAGFPLYVDAGSPHACMTPVLCDLDGDGDIEAVTAGRHMIAWDLPGLYQPDKFEWPMYRHDLYRTGNYHVKINLRPVWNIAPRDKVFVRNTQNALRVRAGDPERKSVRHEVLDVPDGAHYQVNSDGLLFLWRPGSTDVSKYVTFCATDQDGERIQKKIRISLARASADLDDDRDADLLDYHVLWGCLGGPNQEPPFGSCGPADIGNDGDVDLDDFAAFQAAYGN